MSDYGPPIFEFIKRNEPCTRKELVKEFNTCTPKTVYLNVNKLLNTRKIFQDNYGQLSTRTFDAPVWIVPPALRDFSNVSLFVNAFAKKNENFYGMANELSLSTKPKLAILITDLIVIANAISNNEKAELADQYKFTRTVDTHRLTQKFKKLEELINNHEWINSDITTE